MPRWALRLATKPGTLARATALCELDNVSTTLDCVDKNVSRWEQEVAPCPSKLHNTTHGIILGVDIEEALGLDAAS